MEGELSAEREEGQRLIKEAVSVARLMRSINMRILDWKAKEDWKHITASFHEKNGENLGCLEPMSFYDDRAMMCIYQFKFCMMALKWIDDYSECFSYCQEDADFLAAQTLMVYNLMTSSFIRPGEK